MITPVILCGGSGTRLWPVSRRAYPKQFVRLLGEETPFQATARRVAGAPFAAPVVMTAADFRFIVGEQLAEAGIGPGAILIEPAPRNTAPAILAAALSAVASNADATLLILPSDHAVRDPAAFRATVMLGMEAAGKGRIVTFGITPDRVETGYGYLLLPRDAGAVSPLAGFIEKPDAARAAAMIAEGNCLWNAGIFLARADTIVAAFAAHAPEYLAPVQASLDGARDDLDFRRLAPAPWEGLADRSIDYAVLEKAANLDVVRYQGHWSDLGGWEAVWRESAAREDEVVAGPRCTAIDCQATLLRSDDPATEVVGIGLSDVMVVATGDAVLVADRRRSQDVRLAVTALKEKGVRQAEAFPRDHRPWGWSETLTLTDAFQVKRIVVKPGGILSLQSHRHRAEHWVVVTGTARVTIGPEVSIVQENQSVYVPQGATHRLENPGDGPMVLIEVQTGSYFGEDDIIRYEDAYARS
ncbi:mannose-1-phosphate guanylyltransferase/mannose-6-phosphate isomerase [Albidovulum sediminis]|uniref:mannose-1-phosphate guanylyltransferase n=1 Tax=Albidovulum sediminis TaxID=3066345 RepID=A0ABT2NKC8_9RHOB|nr:mannose-1-phosphate guanylyltransferase/mannose-6-phosphate isomerase [Defluviimonas sediminis]MCT8328009.1 mannose-1-phosphate guanylyltransferase/mannose-6-phosphate isomerase [Defluviimonas sediminis]